MKLFHENPIFETVKSKVIISLFETVRLSVSISPRNLYNSLKSIKESFLIIIRQSIQRMLNIKRGPNELKAMVHNKSLYQ